MSHRVPVPYETPFRLPCSRQKKAVGDEDPYMSLESDKRLGAILICKSINVE